MPGRRAVLALPVLLAGGRPAFAAPAEEAGQALAVARAAAELPMPDGALEERMEAFLDSSGFRERAGRNELFVLQGTAPVQVPTTNPDWVRYRQIAYAAALLEAQASFVAEQNTRTMTKTVLDAYKSADEQPPPYVDAKTPGQAAEVLRKLLAVASGKLDHVLQDLGIDPAQYQAAPEAQRTTLLTSHLKTTTIQRSLGDTIGLCPVMTFEEWRNGAGRIGVVAVSSPAMRDFAQQVLTARGEFTPDPTRAQDLGQLAADKARLVGDFGVRRMFDAQGLPVIVSFAQWASAYRGTDPAMAANYRDAAVQQATMLADAQIADFLKGSIDYRREGSVGQEIDRIAVSLPDSASIEDTKRLVDAVNRSIARSANVSITGLRTLSTWTARHPAADLPVIGVVRVWSAGGEQALRAQQAPRRPAAPAAEPGSSGASQGRALMKAADF